MHQGGFETSKVNIDHVMKMYEYEPNDTTPTEPAAHASTAPLAATPTHDSTAPAAATPWNEERYNAQKPV